MSRLPLVDDGDPIAVDRIRRIGAFRWRVSREASVGFARMVEACEEFHAQDVDYKMSFDMRASGTCRGYYPSAASERAMLARLQGNAEAPGPTVPVGKVVGRSYEAFDIGPSSDREYAGSPRRLFSGPNRMPDGLAASYSEFSALCAELSNRVVDVLENVAGLPAGYYAERSTDPVTQVRLLHYPKGAIGGLNPHTDYEAYTICTEIGAAGLEFLDGDQWISGSAGPDELVVMAGDLTEIASNGRMAAARHRVVTNGDERHSVIYFAGLDYDRLVRPIGEPGQNGRQSIPPHGVLAGEHVSGLTIRNYPHLLAQVRENRLVPHFDIPAGNPLEGTTDPLVEADRSRYY